MFGLPTGDELTGEYKGVGQLFLMACYGYILYKAAVLIGEGSEKLLLIYGPGIVGGLVIPFLGAVPDGAIVLVSGLGSNAQCQVSVGVGTLAGSTIMLLTIPWAMSIFLGYRDKDAQTGEAACYPGTMKPKCENKISLTDSVVTTFSNTTVGAKIMAMTAISYFIVAVPAIIKKGKSYHDQTKAEHYPALIGMIVCAISFIGYAIYQTYSSNAQVSQEMEQSKLKFRKWQANIGKVFGNATTAMRAVFEKFDKNHDGTIDRNELAQGFAALGLQCSRQQIFEIMDSMNIDENVDSLTFHEFSTAFKRWNRILITQDSDAALPIINEVNKDNFEDHLQSRMTFSVDLYDNEVGDRNAKKLKPKTSALSAKQFGNNLSVPLNSKVYQSATSSIECTTEREQLLNSMWRELESHEFEEKEEMMLEITDSQLLKVAMFQLLAGTVLVTLFSDPMVDVISNFSNTINVNAFFVSFVITPIASNASEIYSSLLFAAKKSTEGISLGFSALYGAACMNNTLVLCVFCALIFVKQLEWTFLVETFVILFTIVIVAIIGQSQTICVWKAIVVLSLFPISLIIVATLDKVADDENYQC